MTPGRLNQRQMAAHLGWSPARLSRATRAGRVPHYRLDDGHPTYDPIEVDAALRRPVASRTDGALTPPKDAHPIAPADPPLTREDIRRLCHL